LLYTIIKPFIRIALHIFCKKIVVRNEQLLKTKGPVLITANHPNALMDAIIIGALFKQPVHYLTRGDVFNKPWKRKLLELLNMIPIYRIRDGIQNLHLNQYAFDKSHDVLASNGIVLIFIEGSCKHTHQLQPFKKGAARIAFNCWNNGIDLKVMPISIRYHSLFNFGKHILLNIAPTVSKEQLSIGEDDAKNYLHFNQILFKQIEQKLAEKTIQKTKQNFALLVPAIIGMLIHAPFYYPIKKWTANKTKGNEFYDSVLFGLLFFLYPVYVVSISFLLFITTENILAAILLFIIFPFSAWCAVQNKK
jgi:1-acyl-sn-glycerol-3-phosphate acyltransferase